MPKCVYIQASEYASGPKYAKILNIAKFSVWQDSEYARIRLDRVLNISCKACLGF